MKKNRKKYSLNELSSCMENIEQQDLQSAVGGIQLFSQDGTYLGKVGYNNDMRIIPMGFSAAGIDEEGLYNITTPFSSSQSHIKELVIRTISRHAGVETSIQCVSGGNFIARTRLDNATILVNESGLLFSTDNYYDIFLTMDHENTHVQHLKEDPSLNTSNKAVHIREEIQTIEHTLNHDLYNCASAKFRSIMEYYLEQKKSELSDYPYYY